jgi:radical SAM-linked protein
MSARYTIIFRKHSGARFLSHLDLQATLEYAMRRASLPVELSEGFNPHPRYSLIAALSLGHIGERELLELTLRETVPPSQIIERLQAVLPDGITLLSVEQQQDGAPHLASRLESAAYRLDLSEPLSDLQTRISALLSRDTVPVREERNGTPRTRDVRPFILALDSPNETTVRLITSLTNEGSIRPEEVCRQLSIDPASVRITRESIAVSDVR